MIEADEALFFLLFLFICLFFYFFYYYLVAQFTLRRPLKPLFLSQTSFETYSQRDATKVILELKFYVASLSLNQLLSICRETTCI